MSSETLSSPTFNVGKEVLSGNPKHNIELGLTHPNLVNFFFKKNAIFFNSLRVKILTSSPLSTHYTDIIKVLREKINHYLPKVIP
jgi:hypothetical protein